MKGINCPICVTGILITRKKDPASAQGEACCNNCLTEFEFTLTEMSAGPEI